MDEGNAQRPELANFVQKVWSFVSFLISKSLIEINNLSPENQFLLILTIRNTSIGISNNISLIRMKKGLITFGNYFEIVAIVAAKLPRMLLKSIHEREIVAFLTYFCHFGIFLLKYENNALGNYY